MRGWEPVPNSPDMKQTIRITSSTGESGAISFKANPTPNLPVQLRISGDQRIKAPYNSVVVKMRIPPSANISKKSFAKFVFANGPEFRIPTSCGNPPRAGCKTDETFLIADGKWRNYNLALNADPNFTGTTGVQADPMNPVLPKDQMAPTFNGWKFIPSVEPFTVGDPNDAVEIEFIRIASVPSAKDADTWCVQCQECTKWTDKKTCDKLCLGKSDVDKVFVSRPDGWIDTEDNCPTIYNPDQADGNNDLVGDACEDFDGDGVVNACDNCPTTTNSRQKDGDENGVGDVCEGKGSNSCFLSAETLAGPVRKPAGALLATLMGLGVGALLVRRRRRSQR
jgi:hypothetical protein